MNNTFKRPLTPKRTDFSFKSGVFDYKAIREKAVPNPFGIKPDPPPPTQWFCELQGCTRMRDYDESYHGNCSGYCCVG